MSLAVRGMETEILITVRGTMCKRQQSHWLSWLRKGRISFEFLLFDKAYDFRWPSINGFHCTDANGAKESRFRQANS